MRRPEIASSAHWAQTAATGTVVTGTALPQCAVVVPARATIQRIVQNVSVAGIQTSTQAAGYTSLGGMYFQNQVVIKRSGWPDHQLHRAQDIVPVALTSMFDSTQVPPVGQNRLFYGLYSGGDRELGTNIKTSYGGPLVTDPLTVVMLAGLFLLNTGGPVNFNMQYLLLMRVLYYTTP